MQCSPAAFGVRRPIMRFTRISNCVWFMAQPELQHRDLSQNFPWPIPKKSMLNLTYSVLYFFCFEWGCVTAPRWHTGAKMAKCQGHKACAASRQIDLPKMASQHGNLIWKIRMQFRTNPMQPQLVFLPPRFDPRLPRPLNCPHRPAGHLVMFGLFYL